MIIFCDESIFYLNGCVNRQTTRYWAESNPGWCAEVNTQNDVRVMVWGGIWGDKVIGPLFFENTVNGKTFTEMMKNEVKKVKIYS